MTVYTELKKKISVLYFQFNVEPLPLENII